MKPLAPNSMIQNRYLVVQAIGKGGMGEVYLAVDQRLGSAVALKRTFFIEDESLNNAFEREARILARLRHPVLPKVIDHFMENGDQFLVMEHISGDDLAKRLENGKKPFPLSWVMFWADQMLDALSYLHSHEPPIVHRDIKPQNLKLTDENHIVLLDFGLSKDFDTGGAGNLNSASVAGYSPHFASMEQIRGTGTDPRSDIYSLSATLYQLLSNAIPADALTRADARLGGKPDPIIPLSSHNPEVPPGVSDVILTGLSIRQDERFNSAAEMQKALRRAYNQGSPAVGEKTLVLPAPSANAPDTVPLAAKGRPESAPRPSDATVPAADVPPMGGVKRSEVKTEMFSGPPPESRATAPENVTMEGAEQLTEVRKGPTVPAPSAGGPNKRSRKGALLAGLAGVLLLLTGATALGGWFIYTRYYAGSQAAPSPSPSASPVSTPAPTAEAVVATGNTSTTNSDVAPSPTPEPTSEITQQPTSPVRSSHPANTARAAPPRPAQPSSPKTQPKAKPKDERTVILQ